MGSMGNFRLVHANCFDWLREQPPNSIHAVCTDPPYGVIEFLPHEIEKLRTRKGGVWRIPPKIGGSQRAPLPRFTTLTAEDRAHVQDYFREFAELLFPVLVPGAHLIVAGTPMLQYLVQSGISTAGFEVRGAVMRLYRGFRGGDRPKLAETEFKDLSVTPRGCYEPWMLFRKPISERTVSDNLRKWKTGALRRFSEETPFLDIIHSEKTPSRESFISSHPTIKPQSFLRVIVKSLLPLSEGILLDPFCGSGSTLAACEALGIQSIGVEIDDLYFDSLTANIVKLSSLYPDLARGGNDHPRSKGDYDIAITPMLFDL
jgi:DNA modification methylase